MPTILLIAGRNNGMANPYRISDALKDSLFKVKLALSLEEAEKYLDNETVDVILSSANPARASGAQKTGISELINSLRKVKSGVPIAIIAQNLTAEEEETLSQKDVFFFSPDEEKKIIIFCERAISPPPRPAYIPPI
jgi:hypothetical protein